MPYWQWVTTDHINDYFYLAFSSTKEAKLIMFQYKILHDIVFIKENLFRANIANSDLCYLCLEKKRDLKHMLVSCQFVSEFWEAFLYWYKFHVSIGLELSTINILYGIIGNNHLNKLTNHLLLLAKYYIYCCSITEEPLLLQLISLLCIHPDFQTWFDGHDSTCHDSTLITWRIASQYVNGCKNIWEFCRGIQNSERKIWLARKA